LLSQWAFAPPAGHGVNAPAAWDVTTGDSTVVLAIADTGIDWQHPDLGGAAPFTNGVIWTNWAEANGLPGVDDDQDGYVDDVRGHLRGGSRRGRGELFVGQQFVRAVRDRGGLLHRIRDGRGGRGRQRKLPIDARQLPRDARGLLRSSRRGFTRPARGVLVVRF